MPGDAGTVAPSRLDPDAKQLAEKPEPAKHRPVASPGGGERFGAENRAIEAHNGSRVQILMGIDASDDLGAVGCRGGHVRPLVHHGWRGRLRAQPMSDTTVKGRPGPGSHQVTMSVEGRNLNRLPLGGRHVRGMTSRSIGMWVKPPGGGRPHKPGGLSPCGSDHPEGTGRHMLTVRSHQPCAPLAASFSGAMMTHRV